MISWLQVAGDSLSMPNLKTLLHFVGAIKARCQKQLPLALAVCEYLARSGLLETKGHCKLAVIDWIDDVMCVALEKHRTGKPQKSDRSFIQHRKPELSILMQASEVDAAMAIETSDYSSVQEVPREH
eukprot:TRINITY_DN25240_c0_g1_i1.p3 TRINITY_DN25240_c0_g1~~TRINITY_DN25240_c0_g1_i1.p3  ORF type:complete len:127 (-),score=33.28 TRINITY_DN25240_c0_g1_i1:59-439(-)